MSNFTLKSNKDAVLSAADAQIRKAMTECGIIAVGYAKEDCPVDTGRLRASITHKVTQEDEETCCYIGTNVEYGIYVEMGTGKTRLFGTQTIGGMRARPFIKPAVANHSDTYKSIIKKELLG